MKQGVALLAAMSGAPILPLRDPGKRPLLQCKELAPPVAAAGRVAGLRNPYRTSGGSIRRRPSQHLQRTFAREIVALKDRLCRDFKLTEADLPHSPQQRMAEP